MVLAKIILLILFAFQIWYFIFGLVMLKDYTKTYFREKFHVSQWGLVCPFVGLGALASFVYKVFLQNQIFFYAILALLIFTVGLFLFLLKRQFSCFTGNNKICD
jgi:hypothetical protein